MGEWTRETNSAWSKHDLGKQPVSHRLQGTYCGYEDTDINRGAHWGGTHIYIFLPFQFEKYQMSNVSTSNFRSWLRRRMSLKGFWTRQNNEIIRPQKAFLWRICNICANLIYFQLSLNIFTIWSVTIMRTTWYGDDCSQIYMNSMHLVSKIEYLDLTWQFF